MKSFNDTISMREYNYSLKTLFYLISPSFDEFVETQANYFCGNYTSDHFKTFQEPPNKIQKGAQLSNVE